MGNHYIASLPTNNDYPSVIFTSFREFYMMFKKAPINIILPLDDRKKIASAILLLSAINKRIVKSRNKDTKWNLFKSCSIGK
jgi:hypothetical protein